ncbi:MAG TPA: ribonuclease III [Erysipelothrix sp.]|nr:ribonuclease III [Erysipelothrix sp.]
MKLMDWLANHKIEVHDLKLLQTAFVHSSYVHESGEDVLDNERLEFIGDAILQKWSAEFLFHQPQNLSEGDMTLIRSHLVSQKALHSFGLKLGLNQFLKLGTGEEKSGGRTRPSIVADMFEAFLGALYLDSGDHSVNKILMMVVPEAYKQLDLEDLMDYKTKLQEYVQADFRKTVTYEIVDVTGPDNQPEFDAIVKMDGLILGKGSGRSKKKAEQAAARSALEKMVK